MLLEVPCTSEGPYLYLAETTQVSTLMYLVGAANCCAAAMDTRDVQVPGVEKLSYLVDGEDVPGTLGSYRLYSA